MTADVIRLGEGPFISGGGFFVAHAKGYFTKLGIELSMREFADGARGRRVKIGEVWEGAR